MDAKREDIVWAKFRRSPTDTQLIFIPAENKKYCWTTNPEEEVSGNERSNCFSGPFIK
jgi:hypothetical protein